ncbi:polysialyltransferase family glycosyltransferase [Mucilaginibacter sp. OK098]|uniref:polysialyltransferase family glycosyltransferase n=1 Tax=Mucilaginibacter sp. OK098 TaxID=1855297 RepID=UPI0009184141|nr:polysialyltransferase family glycosyltransferase [Mucilaginibacter sp. OK098]SHL93246.1 hypothetical protein SAMN05216524_101223 [Mucilaginibacter sp. OK098]
MNLLIVLDDTKYTKSWDKYDLILCEKKTQQISSDKQFTFDSFQPERSEILEMYDSQYNAFLKLIPIAYIDIFESNRSTAFHGLIVDVYSRLLAVSDVITKFNITEVTCDCYVYTRNYIPFYEAFGEINLKLLFKNSDFLSSLIKDICNDKGIKFSYLKEGSKFILNLKIFGRRYCLLLIKLLLSIKAYLFLKKFSINRIDLDENKPQFYISVRSTVHSEFLLPFVQKYAPNCLIVVGERQFAYGENRNFWERNFNFNVFPEGFFFRIGDFFSVFCKIIVLIFWDSRRFKKAVKSFEINFGSFKIKPYNLLPEFCIAYFEQYLHFQSIKRFLEYTNANNGIVISTEQLTTYPYWLSKAARERQLKSLQIQTTLLNPLEHADFVRADKFLFYDEGLLQAFSIKNPLLKHKFDYWGFLKTNDTGLSNKNKTLNKIIYFTQPYEYESEDEIITFIIQMEKEFGFRLLIKLHPRDQFSRFKKFAERILSKDVSMNTMRDQFDLAITRTSTIGLDCFINDLPVIFCVMSETGKKISATFLDKQYLGYISSFEGIKGLFANYNDFLNYFYKYNDTFKKKNNLIFDREKFDEKVKMFMAS